MSKKIYTPHDAYFKKAMNNPQTARHFIERFLLAEVCALHDLNTLEAEPAEFVDMGLI